MRLPSPGAGGASGRFTCRGYWLCAALLLVAGMARSAPNAAQIVTEPLEAEKAFSVTARLIDDNTVELRFAIANGYYMYRDRFHFAMNGQAVSLPKQAWPTGKWQEDAIFGKVITYRDSVRLLLPFALTDNDDGQADRPLSLSVSSQGCADAGICYPPLHQALDLVRGSTAWVGPRVESSSGFTHGGRPANGLTDRLTGGK